MAFIFAILPQIILNPFPMGSNLDDYTEAGILLLMLIPFIFDIEIGIRSIILRREKKKSTNVVLAFVPIINIFNFLRHKTLSPQFKFFYSFFHAIPVTFLSAFGLLATVQIVFWDHDYRILDLLLTTLIFLTASLFVISYFQIIRHYFSVNNETGNRSMAFIGFIHIFNIAYLPDKKNLPKISIFCYSLICAFFLIVFSGILIYEIYDYSPSAYILKYLMNHYESSQNLKWFLFSILMIYLLYFITSYSIMNLTDSQKHKSTWWLCWIPGLNLILVSGMKRMDRIVLTILVIFMLILSVHTYNGSQLNKEKIGYHELFLHDFGSAQLEYYGENLRIKPYSITSIQLDKKSTTGK